MRRIVRTAVVVLGLQVAFLEVASWLFLRLVPSEIPRPTYRVVDASNRFWVDIDEHFGVWHEPGSTYSHNRSCFVVDYHANSHGMRDRERTLRADAPRAVVLGDSFVEGFGCELHERLSDRLEAALGVEVLNFGTAGSFGTTQQLLQYEHMVKRFDHDVVLVSVLPWNDFGDNDLEIGKRRKANRYRPYWVGDYPDYDLVYFRETLPALTRERELLKSFDWTLREWSGTYRIVRYLDGVGAFDRVLGDRRSALETSTSSYWRFTEADWGRLRYGLERIVAAAEGRPVIVFGIPIELDLETRDGQPAPLTNRLRELADRTGFRYVDLLDEAAARPEAFSRYYFACDRHWSPAGHELAAEVLEPHVREAFASIIPGDPPEDLERTSAHAAP